jgi:Flp pilus assembly protein TadG
MRSARSRWSRWPARLGSVTADRTGAAAVEVAAAIGFLMLLTIGGLDYGMVYAYQMGLTNAAWAGTELARVRHLALGPGVDPDQARASVATVRDAVLGAADALRPAPTAEQIQVAVNCLCPGQGQGGTWLDCSPDTGSQPSCAPVQTFVQVTLRVPYALMFPYPGLDRSLTLSASNAVRLN